MALEVLGKQIQFLIDTGAHTLFSLLLHESLPFRPPL
jgi:predicted aspartyl protease